MPILNDRGIVLRLYDYSETSQIAAVFAAESGRLRLLAKGARKATKTRVSPGMDLLELGDFAYAPSREAGALGTLTEWIQRDSFSGVRRGLSRLYGGMYAAELALALTEDSDPHPELFEALAGLLRELAGEGEPGAEIVRFQAALLKSVGFAPNLRQCVVCGNSRVRGAPAWFSSRAGGLVCRKCESSVAEKRRIAPALLDSPRGTTRPIDWVELLNYHITHVAGREIATAAALIGELSGAERAAQRK